MTESTVQARFGGSTSRLVYSICLAALGVVFLASAVLKAADFTAFAVQGSYYGILRTPWIVRLLALCLIGLEGGVGAALLVRVGLLRIAFPLTALLLGGFSAVLAWAWAFRDLENCGCFGRFLPMTPGEAIFKNVIMLAILAWCWRNARRRGAGRRSAPEGARGQAPTGVAAFIGGRWFRWSMTLCAALAIAGLGVLTGESDASSPPDEAGTALSGGAAGEFAGYAVDWKGERLDLSKGIFIVVLISDTCAHCAEIVAGLNRLSEDPEAPQVVGLVLGEEDTLRRFRSRFSPRFATRLIPVLEFFNLIGDAPPRFAIVKDGRSVAHWDEEMPPAEVLLDAAVEAKAKAA